MPVGICFGTGLWTRSNAHTQREIVHLLRQHDVQCLDTARVYGDSEAIIGEERLSNQFQITTKAPYGYNSGWGSKEYICRAALESLRALKTEKVHTYLLHLPDPGTPIEDTMDGIQQLYLEGRFEKFGVSNFQCEDVINLHTYATKKGYILPSVYQASYNPLCRKNETLLFPTLRSLGISIQAYSPLAGGFLGKTVSEIQNPLGGGRWDPSVGLGKLYHTMYNKPSFLDFLRDYNELSKQGGLEENKAGMGYRWTMYNSVLDGEKGDTMVIGSASVAHLKETFRELNKGPLEDWVVKRLNEMWKTVEADAMVDNREAWMSMRRF